MTDRIAGERKGRGLTGTAGSRWALRLIAVIAASAAVAAGPADGGGAGPAASVPGAPASRRVPVAAKGPGGPDLRTGTPRAASLLPFSVPFHRLPGPVRIGPDGRDERSAPRRPVTLPAPGPAGAAMIQSPNWADFPGLGVDNGHVYITANMFSNADVFQYVKAWVVPKGQLLSPPPDNVLSWTEFVDPAGAFAVLQPAHVFGAAPAEFLVHGGYVDEATGTRRFLRLSRIDTAGAVPAWTDLGFVEVRSYPSVIPYAAQPGTSLRIDTGDMRLLNAVWRDGFLYTTHAVGSDDEARTEVAWYRIDPARAAPAIGSAGPPDDQGRVADPDRFYYYPSVAVNGRGDVALGFTGSSATEFAGAWVTGRAAADGAGTTRLPTLVKPGEASYFKDFGSGRNRWGDYSATVVDPADDTTFWSLQEYAGTPADTWGTWWGSFTIPGTPPPDIDQDQSFVGLVDPEATDPNSPIARIPPDTMGAAGPNRLVTILNTEVAIFDKATGAEIDRTDLRGFWRVVDGIPAAEADKRTYDPKVLYDQHSGRFVMVTLAGFASPNSWILIAVSDTADPDSLSDFTQWAIDADQDATALSDAGGVFAPKGYDSGNGCSIAREGSRAAAPTAAAALALLALPALALLLRRAVRRRR